MFTDGYAYQFGGPKGKKFNHKPSKQLLLSIHHQTFDEQKRILSKTINDWKSNLYQVNDILVLG